MYVIIGKKNNVQCCWFGTYSKKSDANKDLKHLKLKLPTIQFKIEKPIRKNYVNFAIQGAITLAPYLTRFAKYIPRLAIQLKPFGKVAVKNLKQLPKIINKGLKESSAWLPSVLLVIDELKELFPEGSKYRESIKQLDEMGKVAKEIDQKAKEIQATIPK